MASDFSASWELSRGRFEQEVVGLSAEQLNYRLYPGSLSIGEMALHVAGVEIWFICQMKGDSVPDGLSRLTLCATEGVVNDHPFPFNAGEITPDAVASAFRQASEFTKSVIYEPTTEQLSRSVQSALGPVIDGRGALARIAFHSGYHHGQVYQMKCAPDFPTS
ncbi:MAG: DinB family protein [Fimbriimonadaceae bacterium]|nr:DinB family protein [Fimbriimonadaceae bacterium]